MIRLFEVPINMYFKKTLGHAGHAGQSGHVGQMGHLGHGLGPISIVFIGTYNKSRQVFECKPVIICNNL